jgi:hypothetical protein
MPLTKYPTTTEPAYTHEPYNPTNECTWIVGCIDHDTSVYNDPVTVLKQSGPNGFGHNLSNNHSMTVGSFTIPIMKTERTLSISTTITPPLPDPEGIVYAIGGSNQNGGEYGDPYDFECLPRIPQ